MHSFPLVKISRTYLIASECRQVSRLRDLWCTDAAVTSTAFKEWTIKSWAQLFNFEPVYSCPKSKIDPWNQFESNGSAKPGMDPVSTDDYNRARWIQWKHENRRKLDERISDYFTTMNCSRISKMS